MSTCANISDAYRNTTASPGARDASWTCSAAPVDGCGRGRSLSAAYAVLVAVGAALALAGCVWLSWVAYWLCFPPSQRAGAATRRRSVELVTRVLNPLVRQRSLNARRLMREAAAYRAGAEAHRAEIRAAQRSALEAAAKDTILRARAAEKAGGAASAPAAAVAVGPNTDDGSTPVDSENLAMA